MDIFPVSVDNPIDASSGIYDFFYMGHNVVENRFDFLPGVNGSRNLSKCFFVTAFLDCIFNDKNTLPFNIAIELPAFLNGN